MKNIQKLALPTTAWHLESTQKTESKKVADRWLKFENLRELVVIVDEAWETRNVEGISTNHYQQHLFEIPGDIDISLRRCKENAPADWELPALRVVRHENEILGQEDLQMRLRCFPCPDLGIFEQPSDRVCIGDWADGKYLTY